MTERLEDGVPIVRIFRARARAGKEGVLAGKLATTSAALVRDQAALVAYIAGAPEPGSPRDFLFMTIWRDFQGMKALFGEDWKVSLLPPGYDELIESCSVEHYEMTDHLFRAHGNKKARGLRGPKG